MQPHHCSWSEWHACSLACGLGSTARVRRASITHPCTIPPLIEYKSCTNASCTVASDCPVSRWGTWSACSKTCGLGQTIRTRHFLHLQRSTIKRCLGEPGAPALIEVQACVVAQCKTDCSVSKFSSWSTCAKTCGLTELTHRRRSVIVHGSFCSHPLVETARCNTNPCPVDCRTTAWANWEGCTEKCIRRRMRKVVRHPRHRGRSCGRLVQKTSCRSGVACRARIVREGYAEEQCYEMYR
jgi:hypothetical protein